MSTDRDALAEAGLAAILADHSLRYVAQIGNVWGWSCTCPVISKRADQETRALAIASHARHQRDALLASPQFASLIAEAKAEVWDEGYEMGYDDALFDERGLPTDLCAAECPHENPYRAALAATRDTDQAEEATNGGE